jgi:hypothetical protein
MSISKDLRASIEKLRDNLTDDNQAATLKKLKILIVADKPSDRTITVRYTTAKKILGEATKDSAFLKQVRPKDSLTLSVIIDNKKIRDEAKLQKISRELVEKIVALKKSDNIYDMFIYLLFVSGRRTSELKKSKFINMKNSKLVKMNGLLKMKQDGLECEFMTLTPKTNFFKVYNKMMSNIKKKGVKSLNKNLDNRIHVLFGKEITPHTLRSLYANYIFHFENKDQLSLNASIQKSLCHKSIDSSLSYNGIEFEFDKKFPSI